jgi:hypothetical protein
LRSPETGDFDGGGARARARRCLCSGEIRRRKENRRETPPGAGYMHPPRGHRTLFMWHRTHLVTTGLMRREVFKSACHRTMATGHWP